jgi:hypothetical protein
LLLVVQSVHVLAPMPQAESVGGLTHVPLWQHPNRQFRGVHPPREGRPELAVPELLVPELLVPELADPLELPLEPRPELAPEDPEAVAQAPLWHVWLFDEQSWQAAPFEPQAESSVPPVHPRLGSQQPAHEVEQAAAASSLDGVPPSSPSVASSAALPLSLALPLDAPPLVGVLVVVEVPLLLAMPPLDEAPDDPELASAETGTTAAAS